MGRKQIIKRNYDNEGNLISKECSCCHKIKLPSEFSKRERSKDGLRSECKECSKKRHQEYYQDNKDKIKEKSKKYNQENKERIKEKKRKYYQENIEKKREYRQENTETKKEYDKKRYQENLDYFKENNKKYRQENPDYFKEYNKEYYDKNTQEALQQIKTEVESNPDKYNYIIDKEIFGIIYLVHNVKTNRYYVGQTTIGFDNRYPSGWLYEHGRKNSVKHDLQLYGKESFKFTKLFKVAHSQYELDKLEAYYIDYYDSYKNGYNENRGYIFTDRGKEK